MPRKEKSKPASRSKSGKLKLISETSNKRSIKGKEAGAKRSRKGEKAVNGSRGKSTLDSFRGGKDGSKTTTNSRKRNGQEQGFLASRSQHSEHSHLNRAQDNSRETAGLSNGRTSRRRAKTISESSRETQTISGSDRDIQTSNDSRRKVQTNSESSRETGTKSRSGRETQTKRGSGRETGTSSDIDRETQVSSGSDFSGNEPPAVQQVSRRKRSHSHLSTSAGAEHSPPPLEEAGRRVAGRPRREAGSVSSREEGAKVKEVKVAATTMEKWRPISKAAKTLVVEAMASALG